MEILHRYTYKSEESFVRIIEILFGLLVAYDSGWNNAAHTGGTAEGHVLLDTEATANQGLGALRPCADEARSMPVDVAPGDALIGRSNG